MYVLFSQCGYHQKLLGRVFKTCCTSSAMDKTDSDVLRNDSDVNGNFRSEYEQVEGTVSEVRDSDTDW